MVYGVKPEGDRLSCDTGHPYTWDANNRLSEIKAASAVLGRYTSAYALFCARVCVSGLSAMEEEHDKKV
jgi:hypothetical protein